MAATDPVFLSSSPICRAFRQHHLFSSLEDQYLERLAHNSRILHLCHEEGLFHQGGEAQSFYLVLSGAVKLFRVSAEGLTKVIEVVRTGGTFAEALMFLQRKVYPLNAEAMGETQVIQIPACQYKELICSTPESALGILATMAMKLHKRIDELETLTLQNTRHRLGNYLSGLVRDPSAQTAEITLPMAKQLIASQLAMQPETFSRLIKEMKNQGIISVKGAHISVHSVKNLRSFGH